MLAQVGCKGRGLFSQKFSSHFTRHFWPVQRCNVRLRFLFDSPLNASSKPGPFSHMSSVSLRFSSIFCTSGFHFSYIIDTWVSLSRIDVTVAISFVVHCVLRIPEAWPYCVFPQTWEIERFYSSHVLFDSSASWGFSASNGRICIRTAYICRFIST